MSLLSALAFLASAIGVKCPKVTEADLAWMQSQIDDLNRKADNLLADMTRQRDDWQALALSYRREVMEQHAPAQMLQAQANMQAAHAQAISLAQQAQLQQHSMLQNVYTMQNFGQQLDEYVRNCTPGRHELFTRG